MLEERGSWVRLCQGHVGAKRAFVKIDLGENLRQRCSRLWASWQSGNQRKSLETCWWAPIPFSVLPCVKQPCLPPRNTRKPLYKELLRLTLAGNVRLKCFGPRHPQGIAMGLPVLILEVEVLASR